MNYNFENILLGDNNTILNDFITRHTACIDIDNDTRMAKVKEFYHKIFSILTQPFHTDLLVKEFQELAHYKISLDIPYGIVTNEIYGLKNIIITKIVSEKIDTDIIDVLTLFKKINNSVAHLYLLSYIERLQSLNNVRRSSLSDLTEKNLITHYEAHLIWLSDLAEHIKLHDKSKFPQLNHTLCKFGLWLHNDGKAAIQNNSKYKSLFNIHEKLHFYAQKIYDIIDDEEYDILIAYIEKCEFISLSIGTDLALLDQILMNKKITKDPLTDSLNRHALRDLFESQYDLSLATNNPFVLAMCDLDFFKDINDTYGHIAGDHMLKLFVKTIKKRLRASDMVIRYGGEEFVIILPAIDKKVGFSIMENIRHDFENAILELDGQKIQATVSIGMMEVRPDHLFKSTYVDEYIMIVDKNLYIAKNSGRNTIEVY